MSAGTDEGLPGDGERHPRRVDRPRLEAGCRDGGTRRLLQIARTLLEDETRFFADMEVLFALLGEDGAYLHACMQRCPVQQAPYTALAALILFALLGPEELQRLVDSPREAARYFYII